MGQLHHCKSDQEKNNETLQVARAASWMGQQKQSNLVPTWLYHYLQNIPGHYLQTFAASGLHEEGAQVILHNVPSHSEPGDMWTGAAGRKGYKMVQRMAEFFVVLFLVQIITNPD